MFKPLYRRVRALARHRQAPRWLAVVSLAEASFLPVPPDVMLVPMALARPYRARDYALVATLASVAGGTLGYLLGGLAIEWLLPWIERFGDLEAYQVVKAWFEAWGFWAVLLAGFTPIPYKLFTLAAGATEMPFFLFLLAALIGRSMRFFLVAELVRWKGRWVERFVYRYLDAVGWGLVGLLALFFWLR